MDEITSGPVYDRLREAVELALSVSAPSGAWRWADVRATLRELGRLIRLRRASGSMLDPAVTDINYGMLFDELVLRDGIEDVDVEQLAAAVAHEATHAVFARVLWDSLGMRASELNILVLLCNDTDFATRIVSEAIAYLNQALFMDRRPNGGALIDEHPEQAVLHAALRASADPAQARAFADSVRDYSTRTAAPYVERANTDFGRRDCGPPIALRGARRGMYVLPTDAVPDLDASLRDALAPVMLTGAP